MNTSTQSNSKFVNGLNIHLLAFALPMNIVKDNEEVRVSITTIPDEKKQHFTIEGKKMGNSNHVFSVNVTEKTAKIIMVFRKVLYLSESPIIASTVIKLKEFKDCPNEQITNGMITTEVKNINIYYPLQKQIKEEGNKKIQRKVLGQMKIQMTFTTPFSNIKSDKVNNTKSSSTFYNNNYSNKSFFSKESKIPKMFKTGKKGAEYEKLIGDDCQFCDSLI